MIYMYRKLMKGFGFHSLVATDIRKSLAAVVGTSVYTAKFSSRSYQASNLHHQIRQFSVSTKQHELCWEGSSRDVMVTRLERSLVDCKDDEVWAVFRKFKSMHGFPPPAMMSKLIVGLSYSSEHRSLPKACKLVLKIAKENSDLLQQDSLSSLCLSLARAQMPIPASKILRLMIQRKLAPDMDLLCSVFMHLVKTEVGMCLATNILLEICDSFHHLTARRSECAMPMKPCTTIFNLILEACVRFGSSVKGQQIIEAMAQIRVVADVHSVVLFAHIYEMNGLRDELRKLKEFVDRVSIPLARHYAPFYDKLLSLHYDFDDVDAAASLVTDIYLLWGSCPRHENKDLVKPSQVPIGPPNLKEGLKVQVMFELLQKDFFINVDVGEEFVVFKNGKLILSNKGFAQLIMKFKRSKRMNELSELLATIQNKIDTAEVDSICCDVIHACVYSGCLKTAHDILDDMEMANVAIPTSTYMLLLNAYCRENMFKEVEALVKQIRRTGLPMEASDEMIVSDCVSGVADGRNLNVLAPLTSRQSEITVYLVQEMNREYEAPSQVYELNSSMCFFCKAKMIEDAQKIYRNMQALHIQPTVQTFVYLIQGYSSLKMYREITILWGDIKRFMHNGCSLAHRDLYELLVMNFIRGGYFERVLEVISHMKEHNMCADRWMYKQEFLRLHKNLYRSLKATDARTDAQRLRLEHVKAFRMWFRNN